MNAGECRSQNVTWGDELDKPMLPLESHFVCLHMLKVSCVNNSISSRYD